MVILKRFKYFFIVSILLNIILGVLSVKVIADKKHLESLSSVSFLSDVIYPDISKKRNFPRSIVFVGDSMMQYGEWSYEFSQLSNEPVPIINRGIGGNTSSDLLKRLETNVLSINPEKVVLEIGTNDLINISKDNETEITENLINNYKEILRLLTENGSSVYAISILPVPENSFRNEKALLINQAIKEMSDKNDKVVYVDCFEKFYDNDTKTLKKEYSVSAETAHLNENGYKIWSRLILEELKK